MAAYPPPYPPPPPGYNQRDQARLLREQTRAMREAARAQTRYQRGQFRGMRRRSILGPLLVLSLGVVLLLGRLGHLAWLTALTWYGRWWPLLLVGAGLILIAEWAWDERTARRFPDGQAPYVRRSLGGGIIFLLLLLALIGTGLREGTRDGENAFHSFVTDGLMNGSFMTDDNGIFDFMGDHHEQDQTLDLALPASGEFIVDNPHGDVILNGDSTDGRAHISTHMRVFSRSDEETTRKFNALSPNSQVAAGALRLSVPSQDGSTADLTISVPAGYASSVSANHGEVRVHDLKAPVHITANRGDVDIASVAGAVTVRLNGRSSSVAAHDVTGDLTLTGTGQDVTLTNLTGTVSLDGDFYGDTHLEHLSGPVKFHTSRTSVSFAGLKGTFDISPHAELTGTGITGPTTVDTYSRNISLADTTDGVTVTNRNGTVDLQAIQPTGNISVTNENGNVSLTLPAQAAATLQARSNDGHISDEFAPQPVTAGNSATLAGKLGAGSAHVDLSTSNADIDIHKTAQP